MKAISLIHSLNLGILLGLFPSLLIQAQVIPDQSLPENSQVTTEENVINIDGGTTRGNNLFHSFEQFSVPSDNTASFNNAVEIQNIFSRVTGNSISNIEGILATQGNASLFLMNPNGIIFGENASLNVGGSFLATTAESILFEDNTQFDITVTNTPPLLTITAPIGLNLGTNPGDITNLTFDPILGTEGLEVIPGNTIAFLGGSINIEGGILAANEGRIELGAVAANNFVSLTSDNLGWQLGYQAVNEFQDISFSQSGYISSFGEIGADMQLQGKNISFIEGGQVFSGTFGSEAGNIVVKASESVTIQGTDGAFNSGIFNDVEETATGVGKIVSIETKKLTILDGGQISSRTFGDSQGIDLQIKAFESIIIKDGGLVDGERQSSGLFSRVNPGATGNSGTIEIKTPQLLLEGGAEINSSTLGVGKAGNINLITSNFIQLVGEDIETNNPSSLSSRVNPGATGDGGNITIKTPELQVIDGAQIATSGLSTGAGGNLILEVSDTILLSGVGELGREIDSSGLFVSAEPSFVDSDGNTVITTADAGSLNLTANQLIVEQGAKISADTFGRGKGANVTLNVSNLIIRDGGIVGAGSLLQPVGFTGENTSDRIRGTGGTLTVNATESIAITGSGNIGDTPVNSSLFTRAEGTGDAGNLTISTPQLTIADGGNINVSATGTGEAGSLNINTGATDSNIDLTLDNGSFTAETRRGDRGNINIDKANTLQLRNNSQITTNASEQATGGDITITSDTIALLDNSSITANAFEGKGGNIALNTQGIFQEPGSKITASSELGIDGAITINSPDVDPTSEVVQLADIPIDTEAILAQNLCQIEDEQIAKGSSFIITGRGGLTPTSEESLNNVDRVVEWRNRGDLDVSKNGVVGIRQRQKHQTAEINAPVIQQSQGWVTSSDGSVWLVANYPKTIPQKIGIVHPNCQVKNEG